MLAGSKSVLLACDAGQTGIRIAVIDENSREDFSFPGLLTNQDIFPQLQRVIAKTLETKTGTFEVAIGTTALTRAQTKPEVLLNGLGSKVKKVYLAHDSVTGVLGSIGLSAGTMTAVGTGVVTLSVGEKTIARVDGWGNLIGDCGSAYWIGRAGLELALKSYDGRIPETSLQKILWENFEHPEEAYVELQTNPDRVAKVASLARAVIEFADSDKAARQIVNAAAFELALSAATAARRSGVVNDAKPLFSWAGNVMKANLMRSEFEKQLLLQIPKAVLKPPIGEPIDGVILLPAVREQSPLFGEIKVAQK